MTHITHTQIARRAALALVATALAVPSVAVARPADVTGFSQKASPAFVPHDNDQPAADAGASLPPGVILRRTGPHTNGSGSRALPTGVVLRRSGPVDQGPVLAPVAKTQASSHASSSFDWTMALAISAIAIAMAALAAAGALVLRRQRRLGYR